MKKFSLPDNFIQTMSGIKTRREWDENMSINDIAYKSAIDAQYKRIYPSGVDSPGGVRRI